MTMLVAAVASVMMMMMMMIGGGHGWLFSLHRVLFIIITIGSRDIVTASGIFIICRSVAAFL